MLANSHCSCILSILAMQETCKIVVVYMATCPACRISARHTMCPMHRKCVCVTCHQSCTSIGTGKCTGNFALYSIRTCHGNPQLSCTRIGAGLIYDLSCTYQYWYRKAYRKLCPTYTASEHVMEILNYPVQGLVQESVHEIVPYTTSGHVMEILSYPDKYRYQACVGNLTCPLHVLCKYWCKKCSFSSSVMGHTILLYVS